MLRSETPVPLYYQLELQLRDAIESGRYRPGDRLPTESELQRTYGVSRVTVRTALHRLEEDGLISTQRGRGTFVTSQADATKIERNPARLLAFAEDLARQGGPPRVEVLAVERCPAPQRMAALLDVAEGTEVTRVRRVGSVGDAPLWVESRYFHPAVADALTESDLGSASVTALLEAVTGRHVGRSRLRITAGAATRDQAKHLALEPGEPVLINEFTVEADGHPIEAARAVFRADRYAFLVEVLDQQPAPEQALGSFLGAMGSISRIRQEVSG
jgi:DNA-binding GntR family transcriptional regulator